MENKSSSWEKLAFAVGDGGCNFVWTTIGSSPTLYYTDSVGISAAVIGTIMLLTRPFDGVTGLDMGALIDRIRTCWGKARPWVLWLVVLMGLGLVLLFSVPAPLGSSGRIAYVVTTYTLMVVVIYTVCNLSYNILLSLTAPNPKDRILMSSLRFFCTVGVVFTINYNIMNLVGRFGWNGMALAFGVITVALLLITSFFTKERPIAGISGKSEKRIPTGQSLGLLFKNKCSVFAILIFVINHTALGANNGLCIFYARDVLGNVGLMGTFILCFTLPKMTGNFLYPQIIKIMGKWKSLVLGYILEMAEVAITALTPSSLGTAVAGLVPLGVGGIPHTAGLLALVTDVIDYGEWKTGVRIDGPTSSAINFGVKVGAGLGSAIVEWGLAWEDYNGRLVAQTVETMSAIKILFTAAPSVLFSVGLITIMFTNIDKIYP